MDDGKHMPGCGVTRNKTNDYKHEKREALWSVTLLLNFL